MRKSAANREACPVCGGNGYVNVVSERRRRRKHAPAAVTAALPVRLIADDGLPLDERDLALMIAEAFRQTLRDTSEVLRQSIGQVFEEARLAWDRLNPEPPLSDFNNIACALGAFPDFQIGGADLPTTTVVYWAIYDQFTKRRAAGLLASSEGRVRVSRIVATLASSLQRLGLRTTPLCEMADTLGGAR
jgi:hypothetical protein